jgi:hypothetical protein
MPETDSLTVAEALASIRAAIEEARKLRAAATTGPWERGGDRNDVWISGRDRDANVICDLVRRADWIRSFLSDEDESNICLILSAKNSDPWSALAEAVKALEAISIPIGPGACYTLAGEQCWCNQHVAVRSLVRIASTLG